MVRFLSLVGKLKKVERKGWRQKVGIEGPESVAEHSFRTAMISFLLAELEGANAHKAGFMALIHDLPEVITGDITPEEGLGRDKFEEERRAIGAVIDGLPDRFKEKVEELWKEFEDAEGKESKVVKDSDKLEMALQALDYAREGYPKELLSEFLDSAEKDLVTESSKEILEVIKREFRLV